MLCLLMGLKRTSFSPFVCHELHLPVRWDCCSTNSKDADKEVNSWTCWFHRNTFRFFSENLRVFSNGWSLIIQFHNVFLIFVGEFQGRMLEHVWWVEGGGDLTMQDSCLLDYLFLRGNTYQHADSGIVWFFSIDIWEMTKSSNQVIDTANEFLSSDRSFKDLMTPDDEEKKPDVFQNSARSSCSQAFGSPWPGRTRTIVKCTSATSYRSVQGYLESLSFNNKVYKEFFLNSKINLGNSSYSLV